MKQLASKPKAHDNKKINFASDDPLYLKRQELCKARVTLDGKPAFITLSSHKFAAVCHVGTGVMLEWSWDAVEHIIANGGNFKS